MTSEWHALNVRIIYCSYAILAPNCVPSGFADGKIITGKILEALQLDEKDYRLGSTKVFFKAGVLGSLEDMRDERLSMIIAMFQAQIRGYQMRKAYKKLQDQRQVTNGSFNEDHSVFQPLDCTSVLIFTISIIHENHNSKYCINITKMRQHLDKTCLQL